MISTPQPDGTCITTPLLAGMPEDMARMLACRHLIWVGVAGTLTVAPDGTWMLMERCSACGASRARHAARRELLEPYDVKP